MRTLIEIVIENIINRLSQKDTMDDKMVNLEIRLLDPLELLSEISSALDELLEKRDNTEGDK